MLCSYSNLKKERLNERIQVKLSAPSLAHINHPLYGGYDLISSTRLVMKSNIHIHFPLPRGMFVAIFIKQHYPTSGMSWA